MDSEPRSQRKVKFAPKAPPRRLPKPEVKNEVVEDDGAVQARILLRRFNEGSLKAKPKVEKKVSASQIAFGVGGASASIKSHGASWGRSNNDGSQTDVREKEYKEPWDYYSNYPTSLPLRRPYSGNPERLDEEEFGEDAETLAYDENSTNQATLLGLSEENPEANLFLLKLPPTLPMLKQPATAGTSKTPSVEKPCNLNELPPGFMGKLLVYKSGAVKMKIGDTLYDVSSGMDCGFSQDVVAMNTAEKQCCTIGEISKHVTITPDVDAILDSVDDLL
ncbi:DNA-directed RNA polymerase III subunit RPC4 [Senna tora]|uniref:DNA-directed RNA polymerase III subunit RPC4 n=1 Tax=Senna tora TaxID=362788 RepID=A0A835CGG4_9FABA|nr:DNA-directed RNA polymerase III subunit RPC4 [Senna tora]